MYNFSGVELYKKYFEIAKGVNFQGDPLPSFLKVDPQTQQKWAQLAEYCSACSRTTNIRQSEYYKNSDKNDI